MTYAEKLRTLRLAAGLTQLKLGMACGYAKSSADRIVRHWESGTEYPPIDRLRLLAAALKVPLDAIIP